MPPWLRISKRQDCTIPTKLCFKGKLIDSAMCNLSHFKSDLDEFCLIALKLGTKLQEQHSSFEVVLLFTAELFLAWASNTHKY